MYSPTRPCFFVCGPPKKVIAARTIPIMSLLLSLRSQKQDASYLSIDISSINTSSRSPDLSYQHE